MYRQINTDVLNINLHITDLYKLIFILSDGNSLFSHLSIPINDVDLMIYSIFYLSAVKNFKMSLQLNDREPMLQTVTLY